MITDLIKTMTKFSNAISYHQPDLSTNRIVYTSYSDSVIEKFKGQFSFLLRVVPRMGLHVPFALTLLAYVYPFFVSFLVYVFILSL